MVRPLFTLLILLGSLSACRFWPTNPPPPPINTTPPPPAAYTALTHLQQATLPPNDPAALTEQFQHTPIPRTLQPAPTPPSVGDTAVFWIKNNDSGENRQTTAILMAQTAHLNLWQEEGRRPDAQALQTAATQIEQTILPTLDALFPAPLPPGVAGDGRINLLHAANLGKTAAAYYAAADEVVTAVNPYSNQRKMLYVNTDLLQPNTPAYFNTIAHELQHLRHWPIDPNEDAWLNEGLSELTAQLNGYPPERAKDYVNQTDIQLTDLNNDPAIFGAHYAAAYLFAAYLHGRFGTEFITTLIQQPANGFAGIDAALQALNLPHTAVSLFADWIVANYLDNAAPSTPPYDYPALTLPAIPTQEIRRFPATIHTDVAQFGADYYTITSDQPLTLTFTGAQQIPLTASSSDGYIYASLPADNTASHLTRPFDLTPLASATLTFHTWYDIEEGWDYAYVTASTDGGATWNLLPTTATTTTNPQGNSLGSGFTGLSGAESPAQWIEQTADLTPYAGQPILLRFWHVTDAAVNRDGILLDDIAIPELAFYDDAEQPMGWEEAGIVRTTAVLPQQFIVQRILLHPDGPIVEQLPFNENGPQQWLFPMDNQTSKAILMVSGSTPITRQPAAYQFTFTTNP